MAKAENIPGFHTVIDTGRKGPELLILGEMDSLICPEHPDSDKQTGAVHCCGHSAQCAALVGIAAALKEPHALDGLSGKIRLCAVPDEELIEIEYRNSLKEKGIITFFGGKTEFLHRGYFDTVDLAFMVHTDSATDFSVNLGNVGCMAKKVIYKGVAAHTGGSPWNGINALYAASLGLNAVNSIRETFRENDLLRVHPIITKGGSAVNAIPDTAVLESYIRGKTFGAIADTNRKVNRALIGAALSIGANIEIVDNAGYVPGASGIGHGANYYITNPDTAIIGSAKWQLEMIRLLMSNGTERAKTVIANFEPTFKTKNEFSSFLNTLERSGNRITYNNDTAEIKL